MNMSAEEIKRDFLEAKDRKQQIGILADLNCCTRPEIIGVLKAAGVDYRMLPRERKKAVERTGETDGQTAAETGPASAPATPASTSTHTHTHTHRRRRRSRCCRQRRRSLQTKVPASPGWRQKMPSCGLCLSWR